MSKIGRLLDYRFADGGLGSRGWGGLVAVRVRRRRRRAFTKYHEQLMLHLRAQLAQTGGHQALTAQTATIGRFDITRSQARHPG